MIISTESFNITDPMQSVVKSDLALLGRKLANGLEFHNDFYLILSETLERIEEMDVVYWDVVRSKLPRTSKPLGDFFNKVRDINSTNNLANNSPDSTLLNDMIYLLQSHGYEISKR